MRMFSNNKKRKGFTLIELMVVIAIIGVLTAVAVPIILTVQRDSRDSQRLKQLDAIRIASAGYWTEYVTDVDVYENANCSGAVGTTVKTSAPETNSYYVCAQTSPDASKQTQVTLTGGYTLTRASNASCSGSSDKSTGKTIMFFIDRGTAGTSTGKLVLCQEGGGTKQLEYKQQ